MACETRAVFLDGLAVQGAPRCGGRRLLQKGRLCSLPSYIRLPSLHKRFASRPESNRSKVRCLVAVLGWLLCHRHSHWDWAAVDKEAKKVDCGQFDPMRPFVLKQ